MWVVLGLTLALAAAEDTCSSDEKTHKLELDAFYHDCSMFNDHKLFNGPVCGSDGTTYANCVHLACMNHWRAACDKVKIVSKGVCPDCEVPFKWAPVWDPVCGTDNVTYANTEALALHNDRAGKAIKVYHDGECIDPTVGCFGIDYAPWENAVCGTNGRTYQSVQAIADLRKMGQCVDVLHDGGCTVDEVKERVKGRMEMCNLARTFYEANPVCVDVLHDGGCTVDEVMERVKGRMELCNLARTFYEVNPVCGEDGVTHGNPYIMRCFKPNVDASYMGECDSPLHRACQAAVDIDKGLVKCPGEVCGSDGLTYKSGYHLDCATNNDKYLFILHEGACTPEDNPCTNMPEVTDKANPICSSDGVTYVNSWALWCMQRKEDPYLKFFHDGQCLRRCIECGLPNCRGCCKAK
ncbi:serine protease inhibitor dipetalogastin-like [Macrosteles quadrilineatus]|uniref:serine protease inhibitor dipetalogastin-like n=1 Tax=Macrosteles quadrilineatus TaxID=74068 RepID=UPI0023E10A0B|nr:serine protease inhibitor dipetalogastin-like [Macrosteles quadrilineatus]